MGVVAPFCLMAGMSVLLLKRSSPLGSEILIFFYHISQSCLRTSEQVSNSICLQTEAVETIAVVVSQGTVRLSLHFFKIEDAVVSPRLLLCR